MDNNLHSLARRLIELRMECADLDDRIARQSAQRPLDQVGLRRLERQRLQLRLRIRQVEAELDPPQPA